MKTIYEATIGTMEYDDETGETTYSGGYACDYDGEVYKDYDAFINGEGVCYIGEYALKEQGKEGFIAYTKDDFIEMCKGFDDPEKAARVLFDICTWQDPNSSLDELEDLEDFD